MLPQIVKDVYFSSVSRLSCVGSLFRRAAYSVFGFSPPEIDGYSVLHLGCGEHYIPGFLNVDGNFMRRSDIWLDITMRMPFPDKSFDLCYTSNVLEHLTFDEARAMANEVFRVLKPRGGVRWSTPSLRLAVEAYSKGDLAFFSDFPDSRKSLGGRFNNELLCRQAHKQMCDVTLLEEILSPSGFVDVVECKPDESRFVPAAILNLLPQEERERRDIHRSLFVEAIKPE